MVPLFKNVGERSTAKNYHLVSLLSLVSKVFEKLVNNRIVDHLYKCGLFSDFQYGFRSSRSTANPLTVISNRISRSFNRPRATGYIGPLIYPRLLKGFGMLVFFTNVSLMEFQVNYVALFLLFSTRDSYGWFWIGSLHKNSQLILAPFLVLHFSHYTLITLLMMSSIIFLSMLMILLSIVSVIRHLISGDNYNWLLNLNLIYEDWGRKWLVDFNAGKTQLVSFDWSNNSAAFEV